MIKFKAAFFILIAKMKMIVKIGMKLGAFILTVFLVDTPPGDFI